MEQTSNWEKVKILATTASIIIIPVVIAITGNMFSKSMKEKEIQSKFVELSLEILQEQPTDENRNIREWATDVINEYSGVKLKSSATKDLIENIPIPAHTRVTTSFDVPLSDPNAPVQAEVSFGANVGSVNIYVFDQDQKQLASFKSQSATGNNFALPPLDLSKDQYVTVRVQGVSANVTPGSNKGTAQVLFYQDKHIIAHQPIDLQYKEPQGGIANFIAEAKILLKK
jgi:hypothetical protein